MNTTKIIRVFAWSVGAFLVVNSIGLAQTLGTQSMTPDIDIVKWGMTQGGLVVVTLTILWSYRKDFKSVLNETREELATVIELCKECSEKMAESNATHRELAAALDRLRYRSYGERDQR